ncbi:MAG TPA: GDSL-type esterase/lipase family protein [Candidatus Hydrogenedentes bacterium]|nr:GDSL-type esterase/lipase family protein [Candidatus Hydrogenedentota bacterium]HRT20154.1 GDSL-type esterase/lipase family protein [Candidatus Hydrogenedentota bacterium]HRT63188.1 GDSL-type esterase/lipase family protein [Candidatus Hydrogenedentota bacterium]
MMTTLLIGFLANGATTLPAYYGHPAIEDAHGVIAPWYQGLNGQIDYRVRVSMETLKRYPWVGTDKAVMAAPHFVYTSMWSIDAEGNIGAPPLENWMCGDLGQRTVSLINGFADYYRYAGDPAALGFIKLQADYILDYAQTPSDHPWPNFPISVPTKGKPYGPCDPKGFIQLDLSADIGAAILRAYRILGDARYFEAARHWGDLLAQHCNRTPGEPPWPRYANPEEVNWSNELTGSVTFILRFLDSLIRLGYRGTDDAIMRARDAGHAYLNDVLFPKWAAVDTWGRCYWDWECPVISLVNVWAMQYVMDYREAFPLWKSDVRNVLTLLLNRTGVDPNSAAEVYSGAWAMPESPSCCGTSLSYGQQLTAGALAQYAALADDAWARELARRMAILGSYDALDNGTVVDGLLGNPIVAASWLNIIHPLAMRTMLQIMAWMPDLFGPNRENHVMRSSAEIVDAAYEKGRIAFTTFDSPEHTLTVLRLAFEPSHITGDGISLQRREVADGNGFSMKPLPNGDYIVTIRHDGLTAIAVEGDDPKNASSGEAFTRTGTWDSHDASETTGAAITCAFDGNQVRVIGDVEPAGGLADVFIDGEKQRAGIDCWCPVGRDAQTLFARSGLSEGKHELRVVVRGEKNPLSQGARVRVHRVVSSAATGSSGFGSGEGPVDPQRMVFGYSGREDLCDKAGNAWRPATEWIVRMNQGADVVGAAWWTEPVAETIEGTDSPNLYRYGIHAPEFIVNATVAPGMYRATLKFAATRGFDTAKNRVSVFVNGQPMIEKMDVAEKADGPNRVLDIELRSLRPRNGAIEFKFAGGDKEAGVAGEAFIQALELVRAMPYEKDIQAFEEQDRANPPAPDTVFFVGSSTIRLWDLKRCFPEFKTINRGFGGCEYSDIAYYLDRIVTPHKPTTVVLYAGDNDIAHGRPATVVFDDFKEVVEHIRQSSPASRIIVLAAKPSIARWNLYSMMKDFNARVAEYAQGDAGIVHVETSGTILGADGQPRKDMFQSDGLHLNQAGYDAWTALVKPHLTTD